MPFPTPQFENGEIRSMSKEQALREAKDLMSRGGRERASNWSRKDGTYDEDHVNGVKLKGGLPICPYGCGREGTLLEIIRQDDGRYVGIFNDHPCSCIFIADIEIGEPPTTHKYEIGADGEMHLVEGK